MINKLKIMTVIAIILTGLWGLTGCGNVSLDEFKAKSSQELLVYANAKGEDFYSEKGWQVVSKAVADGVSAIEEAVTKTKARTVLRDAKFAIDEAEKEAKSIGVFFTLQEAFDLMLLSVADLQQIATYQINNEEVPISLEARKLENIKKDAAHYMYVGEPTLRTKAEDFNVLKYYGTYNGSIAVVVTDPYHEAPAVIIDEWISISGVTFPIRSHLRISIWTQMI